MLALHRSRLHQDVTQLVVLGWNVVGTPALESAANGADGFWFVVLVLTSLQVATTLRPIVGSSPSLLDGDRKFFLQHWGGTISADFSKP
jgi:hypothetical protein